MADKTQKCGITTISYPPECSYTCTCPAGTKPCIWKVKCPGGRTETGTGVAAERPRKSPHVTVEGNIAECAEMLQDVWQRRVIVPPKLRGRSIRKRTFRGTPEQIAEALGLQLGPKTRTRKNPYSKSNSVWIGG